MKHLIDALHASISHQAQQHVVRNGIKSIMQCPSVTYLQFNSERRPTMQGNSNNMFFLFFFLLMFNDGGGCGKGAFAENGLFFFLLIFMMMYGGMGGNY